jgi:hypothetical protein
MAQAMTSRYVSAQQLNAHLAVECPRPDHVFLGPTVEAVMGEGRVAISYIWALVVAQRLGVDPCWLITGAPSPAAAAAMKHVADYAKLHTFPPAKDPELSWLLETIPQPRETPGVCCYCGCTEADGCGDCGWLDGAHTICSSCLDPEAAG